MKYCPCGTGKRYLDCCGAYLQTKRTAETPEALMRSRYTAFVEKNTDYIRRTMREPALRHFDKKRILKSSDQWLGLEVINAYLDPNNPQIGFVVFIAKFKSNSIEDAIHELSEFRLEEGRWYYVDGTRGVAIR